MAGVKRKFKTWTANLPWKKSRVNVYCLEGEIRAGDDSRSRRGGIGGQSVLFLLYRLSPLHILCYCGSGNSDSPKLR